MIVTLSTNKDLMTATI